MNFVFRDIGYYVQGLEKSEAIYLILQLDIKLMELKIRQQIAIK